MKIFLLIVFLLSAGCSGNKDAAKMDTFTLEGLDGNFRAAAPMALKRPVSALQFPSEPLSYPESDNN